jgi:hypothetical protein
MAQSNLDVFDKEVTCNYRDETYSVRDNGAIYRHSKEGAHRRPLDEKWTMGRVVKQRGYMLFSSERVHRIVATAFHGSQPSEAHVVDHIDSNRQNNRPENLRWVTRLENILLNPITRRRVELAYGSIEKFLDDPSKPINGPLDQDFDWMRSVTKKEAEYSHKRLLDWAESDKAPSGGSLGPWLYQSRDQHYEDDFETEFFTESLTPSAKQKEWNTPTEFPYCPSEIHEYSLEVYLQKLDAGEVFARNQHGESIVQEAELSDDYKSLLILCKNESGVKKWSLARVSVDNQHIVHESLGTFFSLEGAQKQFTLGRGLEWKGGDTIDDYT